MHSAIWIARGMLAPSGEGWFAAQLDGDCRLVHRGKSLALWVPLLWCGPLWWCLNIVPPCFSTISTSQGCNFLLLLHHRGAIFYFFRDAVLVSWTQTHLQAPTLAMALQVRPLVVHLDIRPIFVFLPWYFFPFERQSRVFFTIQATLTVLLLPLVASQLASFEQLRRAWLGLVTNNNPCKESLLYHHWFMGVASKELNYIFPTCRQIREHPSHHRGPGWEQGGQVSIILITQTLLSQTAYL